MNLKPTTECIDYPTDEATDWQGVAAAAEAAWDRLIAIAASFNEACAEVRSLGFRVVFDSVLDGEKTRLAVQVEYSHPLRSTEPCARCGYR